MRKKTATLVDPSTFEAAWRGGADASIDEIVVFARKTVEEVFPLAESESRLLADALFR